MDLSTLPFGHTTSPTTISVSFPRRFRVCWLISNAVLRFMFFPIFQSFNRCLYSFLLKHLRQRSSPPADDEGLQLTMLETYARSP